MPRWIFVPDRVRVCGGIGAVLLTGALLAGCGADPAPVEAPDDAGSTTSQSESPTSSPDDGTSDETGEEGSESPSPEAARAEVTFRDGDVVGGVQTLDVELGQPVVLEVTSDTADEVHVHGVDVTQELTAGKTATLRFEASVPGAFPVELHHAGLVLLKLNVR